MDDDFTHLLMVLFCEEMSTLPDIIFISKLWQLLQNNAVEAIDLDWQMRQDLVSLPLGRPDLLIGGMIVSVCSINHFVDL